MLLGVDLLMIKMNNGFCAWTVSPTKCVKDSVMNCKKYISENLGKRISVTKRDNNPYPMGYEPELDTHPVLELDADSCFQFLIEIIRWIIKLQR